MACTTTRAACDMVSNRTQSHTLLTTYRLLHPRPFLRSPSPPHLRHQHTDPTQSLSSPPSQSSSLLRPRSTYPSTSVPRHPLVFCHGLFGFDRFSLGIPDVRYLSLSFEYWRGIVSILEQRGVEVLIAKVPASGSIQERAETLKDVIGDVFKGREVSLIGHSMGGLDCRYLIQHLSPTLSFKPISLTTLATPHRGSPFADFMIDGLIGRKRLPSLLKVVETLRIPGGGRAFEQLTTVDMERFNRETKDREDVKYMSWGAAFEPGLLNQFRFSHGIIFEKEGPNDGLVSVESSKWGEYKGTLTASHVDLIGWVSAVQNSWAKLTGVPAPYDPLALYLQMAEDLWKEGL